MVVYADLIFLLNGCIDFLLLWLTSGIRKQKVSVWRLFLASVVGGVYSALYLWSAFGIVFLLPMKIFVSMLMIWIVFGVRHFIAYFRSLFVFYFVCFLTGGAMVALHYLLIGDHDVGNGALFTMSGGLGSPVSWLFIILGFPSVWLYTKFSFQSLDECQSVQHYLIPIQIHIDGEMIQCTGLVDTGNQLRDPLSRAPVVVVELRQMEGKVPSGLVRIVREGNPDQMDEQIPSNWMTRIRLIPYRVAGNKGDVMIAFKPDHMMIFIKNEWHKIDGVLIGIDGGSLSSDGAFQAIIHPSCTHVVR